MIDQGSGLLWENQLWVFSDSDNSGGGGGGGGGNEKSCEKLPDLSTSDSQTPSGNEPVAVTEGGEKSTSGDQGKKNEKGIMMEGKGGGESDHEVHIWTERERRKKMRTMFSNLHALLPQLPPKADKSTIVDEAVTYIKTLETTLKKLQTQKLERLRGVATMNYDLSSLITTPPKPAMDTREAFIADQVSSNINNMQAMITATNSSGSSLSVPGVPPIFQPWTANNVILNVCGLDAQFCVFAPKKKLGLLTAITYVLEKYKLEVIAASVWSDNSKCMYTFQTHACREGLIEAFPAETLYKMAARDIDFFINSE